MLNLDYHDFVQAGGSVGYEEQEYRVLKDATDWWKTEEYPDGPDFPQYAAKFQEEGWFAAASGIPSAGAPTVAGRWATVASRPATTCTLPWTRSAPSAPPPARWRSGRPSASPTSAIR